MTEKKCPKCGASACTPDYSDWPDWKGAIWECQTRETTAGVLSESYNCKSNQIAALKAEVAEARDKMGQVSEALTPYLLRFDITNTRCSDAIPRVLAEVRRAALEEAAGVGDARF